jgi:hypothetical protein
MSTISASFIAAIAEVPTITNGIGATSVTSNSARLNGEITSAGNQNPAVTIYYGTTDGGKDVDLWSNHSDLGTKGLGTFYADVSSLTQGTHYYYRCYASNSAGSNWADTTAEFDTLTTVDYAKELLNDRDSYIANLPDTAFTENVIAFKGNEPQLKNPLKDQLKNAFKNEFVSLDRKLDIGNYQGFIQDIRNNIRLKTDGSVDGNPNNDWIIDPQAQQKICKMVDDLIALIESLQNKSLSNLQPTGDLEKRQSKESRSARPERTPRDASITSINT